ncbi:MAG: hypothetical protein ABEI53_01880 [Candidatus Magasanikbacteria bacterium]
MDNLISKWKTAKRKSRNTRLFEEVERLALELATEDILQEKKLAEFKKKVNKISEFEADLDNEFELQLFVEQLASKLSEKSL